MKARLSSMTPFVKGGDSTAPVPGLSARRPLLLGMLTLAVLAAGLFGWGAFASLSGAVIAVGHVSVEARDQPVEHIDGGTVAAILVRNGDHVEAGTVLLRLDDALLRSETAILEAEAAWLAARRNRLEAEFGDAPAVQWEARLVTVAETDATVRAMLDGEQRLFEARRSTRVGQVNQLRERIGQLRKQIAGLQAQRQAVRRQDKLIVREREAQRTLFRQGLARLDELLALEREDARLVGQAGDIAARIAGAREAIAEVTIQIQQIDTTRVEEAEEESREVEARENEVREQLASLRRQLAHTEVRAPIAGEVYEMTVNAPGEVIGPGETMLKLVPDDAALVVRARLEPIHIDQIAVGQEAVLRFSAFPARVTSAFAGRLAHVSADASRDERTGAEWYEIELSIGDAIAREGATAFRTGTASIVGGPGEAPAGRDDGGPVLALTPGMPVEVHIRTGARSPLSYLVKPVTDFFSRSMREE